MTKKALLACGGTGGHLYPGISLATELEKLGYEIIFIVGKKDKGKKILESKNNHCLQIHTRAFPRGSVLKILSFAATTFAGIVESLFILKKEKPSVVVGMGGYASFATVFAAWLLNRPTVIHEQNSIPGLANRILGRFADKIAISFSGSKNYFNSKKTIQTGNPVREEIIDAEKDYLFFNLDSKLRTVFVFGGSQGALAINDLVIKALEYLGKLRDKIQFINITGEKDFQAVKEHYSRKSFRSSVFTYLDFIEKAYAISDLIICRAGASTIAELKIFGKPAILIPYPFATSNHQYFNAKAYLQDNNVGVIIEEKNATPEIIARKIKEFLNISPTYSKYSDKDLPQKKLAGIIEKLLNP